MKDKKKLIIGIVIFLVIIIVIVFLIYKKNDITFSLNGDDNIVVEYGKTFNDPGFIAKNGFGKELNDYVKVNNTVDTYTSGSYKVTYNLEYNNTIKELTRVVMVKDIEIKDLKITLNGEEKIYVIKDSEYKEQGAKIINTLNNKPFDGNINITGEVDTTKTGTYEVNYELNYKDQTINVKRQVIVFDIGYTLSPEEVTTNKVKITLNLDSVEDYSLTILPNDYKVLNKNVEYEVSSNGTYTFTILLKNNEEYKKDIVVDNIIGKYTCSGEITSTGTKIQVSPASDEIKEYEWVINNKTVKGTNKYQEYKIINKPKVNLVLSSGKKYTLNCSVSDKLLYHFKYNLEDTGNWVKPEMQCNTYTANDKTKYDKLLKQAIDAAGGKGSRGGTVEAVRFLIGGLDYRIRYQAPRNGDPVLGKYQKTGLNIGNNKAWGCRVAGYRNGFDCTHFIEWALFQTGFTAGPYSYPKTDTSKVIDKIKPGDLLYVKNSAGGVSHVAIVAGIDREKEIYYVAESVPGYGNSDVGVTLHATKKSTVLKAYTLVGNVPYTKEGTVTDMWLME